MPHSLLDGSILSGQNDKPKLSPILKPRSSIISCILSVVPTSILLSKIRQSPSFAFSRKLSTAFLTKISDLVFALGMGVGTQIIPTFDNSFFELFTDNARFSFLHLINSSFNEISESSNSFFSNLVIRS